MTIDAAWERLSQRLRSRVQPLAVAVSGGVDSLTLMAIAHAVRASHTIAVHAVSPAVPPEASARVRALADERGWALREITAGEFEDPSYLANPLNRCYYCKSNLFAAMANSVPEAVLASGTNLDDLGDFRPGLKAASEFGVWQPFVEANIDKAAVRALAQRAEMPAVSKLPAAPCLASRIETGIAVTAPSLKFVHALEGAMNRYLGPGDHRCRITSQGVQAQTRLDHPRLAMADERESLERELAALCERDGYRYLGLSAYQRGSAFIHDRT